MHGIWMGCFKARVKDEMKNGSEPSVDKQNA